MLQSLKGQALMVTTTLPPNTHWKELLQALRIQYQSKAPYDVCFHDWGQSMKKSIFDMVPITLSRNLIRVL